MTPAIAVYFWPEKVQAGFTVLSLIAIARVVHLALVHCCLEQLRHQGRRSGRKDVGEVQMNSNFDKCMEMLLKHEGGFVDGNKIGDPGGLTNMGITKRTYDEFHGTDIDEEGMRNLTVEDVTPIYRRELLGAMSLPGFA